LGLRDCAIAYRGLPPTAWFVRPFGPFDAPLREEFVRGFSGWLGVFDEVAGVEDFDQGLCGAWGGLSALVFGSLLRDAVEFAQDLLGVWVVVPGDEIREGDVELRGD
jgi:hypothetical protein